MPLLQKDPQRLKRLQQNVAATGSSCVAAAQGDFLALDPAGEPRYAEVRALLLDPSCSGSGTAFSRMDFLLPSAAHRLKGGWS